MNPVGLVPQFAAAATQDLADFPHFIQIGTIIGRIDDGLERVFHHGLKTHQIGAFRSDLLWMGKRHDKVNIRQGIGHPRRPCDIFEAAGMAFERFSIKRIEQVRTGTVIAPASAQVHCRLTLPIVYPNAPGCGFNGPFHQVGCHRNATVRPDGATGFFQQFDGPRVLNDHAAAFQNSQSGVIDGRDVSVR